MTDGRGLIHKVTFGPSGYTTSDTQALGVAGFERTTTINRDPASNLVTSVNDPLNRTTATSYDPFGDVLSITRLAGTPVANTTNYTYDPVFHVVLTVTDPLNHTTTFGYDGRGAPLTVTDALGHVTTLATDGTGRVSAITDPTGRTATTQYEIGDRIADTDGLGRTTTRFFDSAGRQLSAVDPLHQVTVRQQFLDPQVRRR